VLSTSLFWSFQMACFDTKEHICSYCGLVDYEDNPEQCEKIIGFDCFKRCGSPRVLPNRCRSQGRQALWYNIL